MSGLGNKVIGRSTTEEATFAKMRRDHGNLDRVPNQTEARPLVPIHAASPRTQLTVAQMGIRLGALLGGGNGREELVAREVGAVIEEEWRGEVEVAAKSKGPGLEMRLHVSSAERG